MSVDASAIYRKGEIRPFLGTETTSFGATITIQSGATVSVYDQSNTPILNGVPVTGNDTLPKQTVSAWYDLDTTSMAIGKYFAVFNFQGACSDGITRTYKPALFIKVLPLIEATYEPAQLATSALYQCRLAAADVDPASFIWNDSELLYFLSKMGDPELAAARALRSAAADNAKIAVITTIGKLGNDETKVYTALLQMATALESRVIVPVSVNAPDQIFSMDNSAQGLVGTMTDW